MKPSQLKVFRLTVHVEQCGKHTAEFHSTYSHRNVSKEGINLILADYKHKSGYKDAKFKYKSHYISN